MCLRRRHHPTNVWSSPGRPAPKPQADRILKRGVPVTSKTGAFMTDDGGPAFPINSPSGSPDYMPKRDGMSLRDWFAGQALAGLCAPPNFVNSPGGNEAQAHWAYELADAMLCARTSSKE